MDNQYYFSSSLFPLCITFLVFIFMVFKIKTKGKGSPRNRNLPPGPWKLPIIGHLHHLLFCLPHQGLRDLAKKHGPSLMHLQLGELSHVVVSSAEAAKEVMKTHDINFANRPRLLVIGIIFYNFSDVGWSSYGEYWRQLKKLCTLELLSSKRVQSFRSIREEEVSNLIQSISSSNKGYVNLGEMLCNLSYTITMKAAFSGRCKQHEAFISLMKQIVEAASGFSVAELFPSIKLLRVLSGFEAKLERLHHDVDEILESIIEERRTSKAKTSNANGDDDDDEEMIDLLDVLLDLQENDGLEFPLTTDNIKAVILDILIGGTDTGSSTMEWAMAEMMKHPRVLKKAQAEVRQVFDTTGHVKESGLHELNYLKLVIKETLRLHPPVPLLIPRENRERCEINGYEIPAKTRVFVNAWAIGRDPNYWDEAERFNPERFVDSSVDYKGTNFGLIPFGAGRRMCPGISFGTASVELTLANLLFHFDWKLPDGMKPEHLDMTETLGGSIRRKHDLHLIPIPY